MRLKTDIEKFPTAKYKADYSMFELKKVIDKFIEEDGLEMCPDFQRGHVWTEAQEAAYVEFVLRGGTTGLDFYFNHPGWMSDFEGQFVCVDGLQRITSVIKFLNNELPIFGGHRIEDIEDAKQETKQVWFHINVNNLQTRAEVLKWYLDFNSGGTIHSEKELDRVRKLLEKEQGKQKEGKSNGR